VFFLSTPQRTFYERVKLFINFSNQSHGQALFWLTYTALLISVRFDLPLSFRFPGSDAADLGLNRPGFCGIPTLTVFTLMVTMILARIFS
jgi:hypothetical protein